MFFRKKTDEISVVKLNELLDIENFNESQLVEITDKRVIERITSVVPRAAQILGNTAASISSSKLANGSVYQAILPSGAKLVNSTTFEGAKKAMFHQGGKIAGHADLISVEENLNNIGMINAANAAMGVAALVVGQYYLHQINEEISVINEGISKIRDFQMNEYKSKVITLVTQVKRASDFQVEVLENTSLCTEEISRLQVLETSCLELLNQSNIEIEQIISRQYSSFDGYSRATKEIADWQKYQTLLINTLFIIADLNYTFHFGTLTSEQCYSVYESGFNYTEKIIELTKMWHLSHENKLGIDINHANIRRNGLDAIVHSPLSLFDKKYQYKSIKQKDLERIQVQKNSEVINRRRENKNLFSKDTRVIFYNGKVFYLPA